MRTRDVGMSLEYRLWQILCQQGWSYEQTVTLTRQTGNTYGIAGTYPWVFWDAECQDADRSRIKVYRGSTTVNSSQYTVNFLNRTVQFTGTSTGAITADVETFAVNLLEGYPDEKMLEMTNLPVIAYTVEGKQGKPFDIGSLTREHTFPVTIDILANNDGQCKDLADNITDLLTQVTLFDMSEEWLLLATGDVNTAFDHADQQIGIMRVSPIPSATFLKPRTNGSDKERFRATISTTLKIVMA